MSAARVVDLEARRHPTTNAPDLLLAREAAARLRLPLRSLYALAAESPTRFGVIKLGRALRFRRIAIDAVASGNG